MFLKKYKSLEYKHLHLWVPNLFECKGGIQVYLQNFLQVVTDEFPSIDIVVFDKLDRAKPKDIYTSDNLLFFFSGSVPGMWQTLHFAVNVIIASLINRPTLILCGHMNFAPVAFWIHRFLGIPYWILVYGIDAWEIKDPLKKKALYAAQKIASISEYTRDRLIHEQNLDPEKFSILPVTFDANRFQIAPKPKYLLERYGLKPEQSVILTVARLLATEQYKGYDTIIAALPEIKKVIHNVHYVLVGKGDDLPRIEELIAKLELQNCVTLTGFVPDEELCDHYNLCDVFAMPSKQEGFGIVYLEALACGKPTLAGNQDGATDALCRGELGVLIDPEDTQAIAQALIQILQRTYPNPLLYQPEILRQKVIERFGFQSFQKTLGNYLEKYLGLI
ncbi:glycosyltransferase [Fischerella thermalis CCMEE 5198]|jgi:glycosyltransferase involved in cell wall biosynthesis|uniref:glycosyltransferase n=1 Tax=Fischerella thermalis TaxID=372787 RepID=UPI000C7F937C|nr:glycosyltransferase [Fischerella thermalis]PMB24229.1 glycosyltransferase [Fischerella thermalis CCMEE 5198]